MPEYAVALGTFDGLHKGHLAVLNKIREQGLTPVALTFDAPPKLEEGRLILSLAAKKSLLNNMGILMDSMDFQKVKDISPKEFLYDILAKYSPKIIASGFNFRFGRGAEGDADLLKDFCLKNGIEYRMVQAVSFEGSPLSSTRIRQCVERGEVEIAAEMLGRPFEYSATVIHGAERGRAIGFPTLNQAYPTELITPKFGVYASRTELEGREYFSVTDIGIRPTFKSDFVISETHLLNYSGNAYGKQAKIKLVGFLRGERQFGGIAELKEAIARDRAAAEELLNKRRADGPDKS